MVQVASEADNSGAMKNLKRFVLGAVSSVLLAVGLSRAAETIDPVSGSLNGINAQITGTAPDTGGECNADLNDQ
jgi:hypothetical protein